MIKRVLIWATIICSAILFYCVKITYNIDDDKIALAVICIGIVGFYYHFDTRLGAVEERVIHTDYSRIKIQINEGERHKPHHQPPESLVAGGAIASWIRPAHETLFQDFRFFGALLNENIVEPWSIEELNDTSARGYDAPDIGRQYQVWYNACRMGRIQVTCGYDMMKGQEPFTDSRQAHLEIELNYLRFVPYDDALSLISKIIFFIRPFNFEDAESSHLLAIGEGSRVLAGYLWESVRQSDIDQHFEYSVKGSYELLRKRTDYYTKEGIDPLKKWGGDRSW